MSPKVSIIVTSYCPESKRYLDLCMRSISMLTYKNIETILVGRHDYLPKYENTKTIAPEWERFWNGHGINFGVENASPDSDYYFILNDDVILTRNCIEPLLMALQSPQIGQVMPAGNDMQARYFSAKFAHSYFSDINYMENHFDHAISRGFTDTHQTLIFADTLCLYAQMISKKAWEKVGPMDDNSGLIDIDYSLRIKQAGLMNAIELGSLVWHFGGRSVEHTLTTDWRQKQKLMFNAKWEKVVHGTL